MEKSQFNLCVEVLRRLDQAGVLHKLIVLSRRPTHEKQEKDKESATRLLTALIGDNQEDVIKEAFQTMPRRWQTKVRQQLTGPLDAPILELVSGK